MRVVRLLGCLLAILFAAIFCIAGVGCGITAVKILWAMRKLNKINSGDSHAHRENVQIHIEEHYDV